MPFSTGVKRKTKGLVIGVDMENTAFNKTLFYFTSPYLFIYTR